MKKVKIDNKLCSVIELSEYTEHPDIYNPKSSAVVVNGGETVLPIKTPGLDTGPGIYYQPGCSTMAVVKPSPAQEEQYSAEQIIDFTNAHDIGEVIAKNKMLCDIQADLMMGGQDGTTFCLTITQDDTPEMVALKTAINAKQIDKRLYEDRFPQFQNDMRLLKGHSITLSKLIGICQGFDISCTMILSDKEGAVHPMGDDITINLTDVRPSKK